MTAIRPSSTIRPPASEVAARGDREQLLTSIHELERALSSAATKRERAWLGPVLAAMRSLEAAMQRQFANATSEDGLLSQVVVDAPHLSSRIDRLKKEYCDLLRQISTLRDQFASEGDLPSCDDIRQRLAWLLTALRHHQSRETDLVFEAANTDLGALD